MRLTTWLFALIYFFPAFVFGQTVPPDLPPEPMIYAQIERRCATETEDAFLAREIQLRLPTAFFVRGEVKSLEQKWKITWRPLADATCELLFEGGGNRSQMLLGPNASFEELQLAASRIAWLVSVSKAEPVDSIPDDPNAMSAAETKAKAEADAAELRVVAGDAQILGLNIVSTSLAVGKAMSTREPDPVPTEIATRTIETPPNVVTEETVDWKFSIFPPLDFASMASSRAIPKLSLNLFAGSTYGVRGVEFGLGVNHIQNDLDGVQLAIVGNLVGNRVDGIQVSGGFNHLSGQLDRSGQFAGLFNVAGAQSDGVQFSGVANVVGQNSSTIQLGAANIAGAEFNGVQAGVVNLAGAGEAIQAGVVNVSGAGDGIQAGVVNVAESGDMSFGLVNVFWGEPLYIIGWLSSAVDLLVGLQHGGKLLKYNYLVGVGSSASAKVLKFGLGLGLHGTLGEFLTAYELNAFQVLPVGTPIDQLSLQLQLKASLAYPLGDRLAVFGGIDLNAIFTGHRDSSRVIPEFAIELESPSDGNAGMFVWPGLHVGFRL